MANNEGSPDNKADDEISLEALVADDPSSPPGGSLETIDEILKVEDPGFAESLTELKQLGETKADVDIATDADVDSIVARERAELGAKGPKRLFIYLIVRPLRRVKQLGQSVKAIVPWLKESGVPMLKSGAKHALLALKTGLLAFLGKIKGVFAAFGALPGKSKLLVFLVIALGAAAAAMSMIAYKGHFLPNFEKNFVTSLEQVAGEKFPIEKDAKWVDLFDPMLHPEHIVLIERIIANLKPPGDGTNPMALIDLYIEAGTQESAVELKDRDAEARDVIGRTLEQMTYEDLATDTGKNKLKIFVRQSLNEFLTRGRIRRVFFKSIVLKP